MSKHFEIKENLVLLCTLMGIENHVLISVMIPGKTVPGSPGEMGVVPKKQDLRMEFAHLKFIPQTTVL